MICLLSLNLVRVFGKICLSQLNGVFDVISGPSWGQLQIWNYFTFECGEGKKKLSCGLCVRLPEQDHWNDEDMKTIGGCHNERLYKDFLKAPCAGVETSK
jgi:hypothetical protein